MQGKEPAAFFDCRIYNDQSGAVEAEGNFAYGERTSAPSQVPITYELVGTPFPRLDYRFFDGEVIHLQGSWVLVPDGEITYPFGDGHGKRVQYEGGRQVGPETSY